MLWPHVRIPVARYVTPGVFVERANKLLNLQLHLGNQSKQLYVFVVPIVIKDPVQRLYFAQ